MKEIWKDIKGYEGRYQVSNLGRVRSLDRKVNTWNGGRISKGQIIKKSLANNGYYRVELSKESIGRKYKVSRLVAKAFIPNHENKPQVNHIDGDKTNDFAINLEWCTRSENMRHALDNGLKTPLKGEKHHRSKLSKEDVLDIRAVWAHGWFTQADIAKAHGLRQQAVSDIITRRNWKHI